MKHAAQNLNIQFTHNRAFPPLVSHNRFVELMSYLIAGLIAYTHQAKKPAIRLRRTEFDDEGALVVL